MSYILSVKPQLRLQVGILISIVALIAIGVVWNSEVGFLGGFIAGILLGLGLGLILTYKKTNTKL